MNTSIEKHVVLRAPLDRVWRAISDAEEFGRWFGVRFDGPFVEGPRHGGDRPDHRRRRGRQTAGAHAGGRAPGRSSRSSRSGASPTAGIRSRSTQMSTTTRAHHAGGVHPVGDADGVLLTITESGFDAIPRRAARPRSRPTRRLGHPDRSGAQVHRGRPGMSAQRWPRRLPLLQCARRSESAAHHRPALRSGPELDIASHQRHSGHPAGGQQAPAAAGVRRAGHQQPAGSRTRLDRAGPNRWPGPATTSPSCRAGGTRRWIGCGLMWRTVTCGGCRRPPIACEGELSRS